MPRRNSKRHTVGKCSTSPLKISAQQATCRPFGGGFFMVGSGACHSGRVGVGSGHRLAGVPATGRPDGYVPINLESGAWCPLAAVKCR